MSKEFFTYQQQMEKLRSSGLAIEDEEACCRVLADIGYFPVVNGYHRFPRRAPGYTAKAPLLGMMCLLVLKRSSRTGVASASFPGRKAIGWSFPRGR